MQKMAIDDIVKQAQPVWFTLEYREYVLCDYGTHVGFRHRDFDGLGDRRYGHADTLKAAKQAIDDQIDEISGGQSTA